MHGKEAKPDARHKASRALVGRPDADERMSPAEPKFSSTDYTERHADVFSARYDDGLRAVKVDAVRRRLGDVRGRGVLDLGCGIGYFASLCSDLGAAVVACDFAEAMVDRTRRRYSTRFPLVRASAERPPFRPESFDVVLALDLIEHLYHAAEMLKATRAILRPAGRLIITTDRIGLQLGTIPHTLIRSALSVFSRLSVRRRPRRKLSKYDTPQCTHVHEYGIGELVRLVEANGLRLTGFDTFPNRASFGPYGHLVELLARGPLRRYKWGHCIYEFSKVGSPGC
jgi:SAM-dependent methyltransferase